MSIRSNTGALIIRIGFGGMLYISYHKESPTPYSNYYKAPTLPTLGYLGPRASCFEVGASRLKTEGFVRVKVHPIPGHAYIYRSV